MRMSRFGPGIDLVHRAVGKEGEGQIPADGGVRIRVVHRHVVRRAVVHRGDGYSGWQRQTNAPTVQQTLEEALSDLVGGKRVGHRPAEVVGQRRRTGLAVLGEDGIDEHEVGEPLLHPEAVKFETLTYSDVLKKGLRVMDAAAISLARDNKIPLVVLNMKIPANIRKAVCGEHVGTIVQ